MTIRRLDVLVVKEVSLVAREVEEANVKGPVAVAMEIVKGPMMMSMEGVKGEELKRWPLEG